MSSPPKKVKAAKPGGIAAFKDASYAKEYYEKLAACQHAPASESSIRRALGYLDASDRDTWIRGGMVIKVALGEAGFVIFDDWSATANNYSVSAALASWKSFKTSGGVGVGTLFYLAKKNGYVHNATDKATLQTPEEIAAQEAKQKAEEEAQAKRRAEAAVKAATIWHDPANTPKATQPTVSEHPYLKRKGIQPHGARVFYGSLFICNMDCNGALMLPTMLNGKITSLQFINKDGDKRFLSGGEIGSCLIGKFEKGKTIGVVEGFATGASIYEATGFPVYIAFSAGNLRKIAEGVRAEYPDARIVVCADIDESGTGLRKAKEAAKAVGGLVSLPVFGKVVSHE